MQDGRFEWDDVKARSNLSKHDVSFEIARAVFDDPNRTEEPDDDPDEERWIATGMASEKCLVVVFTERNGRTRIISARKANVHEQSDYFESRG